MVKWLMNVVTLISGTAKRCWKLPDRKVEYLVMQCLEVNRMIVVVNVVIRKTQLFVHYGHRFFLCDCIQLADCFTTSELTYLHGTLN